MNYEHQGGLPSDFAGYQIEPNGVTIKYIRVGIENIASKKSTGEKLFYHNDHLGGVNVITNTSGLLAQLIEYDPWGKISRSEGAGDSLRRFTGKMLDTESGLLYYGGRYYDPELGRFISPDPFVQAPDDPQNLNRYSYVRNNPVNLIDPSGYGFWSSIGKFFKKLFRGFTKYVLPGICPVCYAISKIPLKVNAGINIFGGLLMLATGNPAGFFFVASGAMSFGRSNGWQIASGVLSGIGAAASGGGGGGPGNDYPGGGFGGLMLVNALGGSRISNERACDTCNFTTAELNRFTNFIYNETAGLRGSLHDARVAIGYVGMNREAAGIPLGIGTAPVTLTVNEAVAIEKGVPSAVQAYTGSRQAAEYVLSNPLGDPTGGAQHFLLNYGQVPLRLPGWARGTPTMSFGPFRNVAGGGDVPRGSEVNIQIFP